MGLSGELKYGNSLNSARSIEDADALELAEARRKCAEIVRNSASNFYYAFVFLPEDQRYGIEALYAFCRAGDDAADASSDSDSTGLIDRLQRRLDLCYKGMYIDDLTLSLADAVKRFKFDKQHFNDLLLGIKSDLTVKRYSTFDDLYRYCYLVASTVGLLCLKIFGCDNPQSRKYAENLGIGMQITNILRDLKEDMDRDRIYLPLVDLEKFDLTEENLFEPAQHRKLVELVRWEVKRAEDFFQLADSYLQPEMLKPLFPARIMGVIYSKILDRIGKTDRYDKRVELSTAEKFSLARHIFVKAFQ